MRRYQANRGVEEENAKDKYVKHNDQQPKQDRPSATASKASTDSGDCEHRYDECYCSYKDVGETRFIKKHD